jgi:hypothetical protein
MMKLQKRMQNMRVAVVYRKDDFWDSVLSDDTDGLESDQEGGAESVDAEEGEQADESEAVGDNEGRW